MAVITIRINDNESKILKYLSDYCHEDKSAVIKKSLYEMYEDIQDVKFIDNYIKANKKKQKKYVTADEFQKYLNDN